MRRTLSRFFAAASVALLGAPHFAFADEVVVPPPATQTGGLTNPLKDVDTLPEFLTAILNGLIEIGTIVLIMMLVYVGFLFVAARGNPESIQKARSALMWTVIGGLILLGATTIQLMIQGTVNSLR